MSATRRARAPVARVSTDGTDTIIVRPVRRADLDPVIDIDATVTGLEKRKYWTSVYRRYGSGEHSERQFLVAVAGGRVVGFIIGEIRDWEFGSPPCGWVFAIDVDPRVRLGGVGTRLLAISAHSTRRGTSCARCWRLTTADPEVLPQPGHDGWAPIAEMDRRQRGREAIGAPA
jgi:GNAT superfamily N-acetyltransferase